MNTDKIKWLSIQSLAGGMMLGAEEAFGCPPVCTIDYDGVSNSDAYVYYMNEVRHEPVRQLKLAGTLLSGADTFVSDSDKDYFRENCHDIDVVVSVPICSGLSVCTCGSARGGDAVRNDNMLNITRFVFDKVRPKVYIFENAPALFTDSGKKVRDKLTDMAKESGYSTTFVKTDTHLHENVQYRERTFAIFWRDTKCPQLRYVNNPGGTIADYLSTISSDAPYNTKDFELFKDFNENNFIKYLKKKYGENFTDKWPKGSLISVTQIIEQDGDYDLAKSVMDQKGCEYIDHMISKRQQGKNFFDSSPLYYGDSKVSTVFGRLYDRLIHPSAKRGYTVREFMKFMGLPDDYQFPDVMKHINYIGQNVPVVTSRDWCLQIRDYLDGNLKITVKDVDMFNNTKKPDTKFVFGYK